MNDLGVATMLADVLQPVLLFVQQDRTPTLAALIASEILISISLAGFASARRVVRALEG